MSAGIFGYGNEAQPKKGRYIKRDQGGHERWADAILPADAEAGTLETPASRRPLLVVASLVVLTAVLLGSQLVQLQLFGGQRNLGLADGNRLRQKITRAPRGIIYDRHAKKLVENQGSVDITVTPSLLPSSPAARQAIYAHVGDLLNLPTTTVGAKAEGDCVNGEVAAKKSRSLAEVDCLGTVQTRLIAANVPQQVYLNFDQSSNDTPGFSIDNNSIRQYDDGGQLSAILGYTGRVSQDDIAAGTSYTPTDFIGKLGLERQYEGILKGQNGSEQTEVDASGRPIKVLASRPSEAGKNLILTVDSDLQKTLSGAITEQMQASGASRAAGIALDPRNGEILAAVNLPTYDNNLFAHGISQADYTKLVGDRNQPLFNKAVAGAFPTGSIIKPLVASAALQDHAISPSTTVNDTGSIVVHNKYDPNVTYTYRSYTDYETGYKSSLGVVNVVKALAVSSDVFFYTIGGGFGNIAGLGVDKLTHFYNQFGLGKKPDIDLPEQSAGRVPTPDWKQKAGGGAWTVGDTYNISIGQGDLLASPLQMAVAEAAIANGGTIYQPHFLKEVQNAGGSTTQTFQPKAQAQNFISPANLATVRQGMHDVVYADYGTACCKLRDAVPVQVGAKTGTAQTDDTTTSTPDAWFTAFAPYDNPQIEIVVLIQNAGEGAKYAAPAVRNTLAWCFTRPGGCVQ